MTSSNFKLEGLSVDVFGATDVGRKSEINEDAFAVIPAHGLFLLADGVGGAKAGELASQAVAKIVPARLLEKLDKLRSNAAQSTVEKTVRQVLQEVNDAMVEQAGQRPDLEGMGTTIVLVLFRKGMVLIAHLGDSRAYLFRSGQLRQITEDHSLAAQLVRWGKITETQAEDNPGRSTLVRYLGADEKLNPDFGWIKPESGDQILLCTDGLTDMVHDERIRQIMSSSNTEEACCKNLISCANEAGGEDNITVINIRFHEVGSNSSAQMNGEAGTS